MLLNLGSRNWTPPSAPFVPTDIAGLALWLDAGDTATITATAGAVSQWNDKSGTGNHWTSSGSLRPTTGTRTINSLNVLDFDGTDDVMVAPSGLYAIPNSANTVFCVYASDNTGDTKHSIFNGVNATPAVRWGLGQTTTAIECINRTTSALYTSQTDARSTATKIIGQRRTGTTLIPFVNGVKGTDAANSENFTCTNLYMGAQTSSGTTNRLNGVMASLLIYNSALSDANCNLVGNYLASRWAATWTGF